MSELYDRLVRILRIAAQRQQGPAKDGADGFHQWIVMNPTDWAKIQNELGTTGQIYAHQTPGTWLLGVDVQLDEDAHEGMIKLRTDECY